MLAAVAAMSEIAFRSENPLAYLVFPALGWAALRFGRRGATLAITVAVGFAVWNTTHYHGPFVFDSITLSVLNTQLYIAVAALSTLSPRRAGVRAQAVRRATRRLPRPAGQGGGHRAPATRAQPPRRRAAAPDRARHPAGVGGRHARDEPRAGRAGARGGRRARSFSRSTSCASSRTASSRRCSPTAASPWRSGSIAARSTVPIDVGELPSGALRRRRGSDRVLRVAEAVTNAQKHARASSIRVRAVDDAGHPPARDRRRRRRRGDRARRRWA